MTERDLERTLRILLGCCPGVDERMNERARKREGKRGRRFTNDPVFDVASQVLRRSTPYTTLKTQWGREGGWANGQVHAYTRTHTVFNNFTFSVISFMISHSVILLIFESCSVHFFHWFFKKKTPSILLVGY